MNGINVFTVDYKNVSNSLLYCLGINHGSIVLLTANLYKLQSITIDWNNSMKKENDCFENCHQMYLSQK